MKLPKPKTINKSALKRKADALFSRYVRSIGYCQAGEHAPRVHCGGALQTAHIQTRSVLRLRYELANVLCLCAAHHRYFHQYPLEFIEFLLRYYKEKLDYVQTHRYEHVEMTADTYREIIHHYENHE